MPVKRKGTPPPKRPSTLADRTKAFVKLNPIKSILSLAAIVSAIGGAFAQLGNFESAADYVIPATLYYARHNQTLTLQDSRLNKHDVILDLLFLNYQRQSLKDIVDELATNPNSRVLAESRRRMEKSIKEREDRLERETRAVDSN